MNGEGWGSRLPEWLRDEFWSELDPILERGVKSGRGAERQAVSKVLRLRPDLRLGVIWARVRRIRQRFMRRNGHGRGVRYAWTPVLDGKLQAVAAAKQP